MRTYVDFSQWSNEFEIDITLTLEDNGRFSYSEDWHCYGAGFSKSAGGTWRQEETTIFLHCDSRADGSFLSWSIGEVKQAVDLKDSIRIDGNFEMSLSSDDSAQTAEPEEIETTIKEKKPEPPQTIAKLHFSDGRVLERRLPKDLSNALFTQTYYRLTDDLGGNIYIFKARENPANSDSQFIDYDEILTENNDGD